MNYLPTHFINISFYLKKYLGKLPDPPLHPGTRQPIKSKELETIFSREMVRQEMSLEKKLKFQRQSEKFINYTDQHL